MFGARFSMLFLLALAAPAGADVLYVTNTADSGAGSLRDRIDAAAASGDEIQFQIPLPATITVTTPLRIEKSLTLTGPGADLLTLSGGDATRVIEIDEEDVPLTVAISGLTVAHGRRDPGTDVATGGGISNQRADLTITACAILDNVAVGGLFQSTGLGATGGGLWTNRGTVVVRDTTIARNRAIGHDGGAFVSGGYASGGGVYSVGDGDGAGDLTLVNVTLSENVAEGGDGFVLGLAQGGGVFAEASALSLEHCTVADNLAQHGTVIEPPAAAAPRPEAAESELVAVGGVGLLFGDLALSRTLVTGNLLGAVPQDLLVGSAVFTSGGYNIVGTDPGVAGDPTDDFGNGTDPLLGALAANGGPTETRAIPEASPAFDAIPVADCTETADQRFVPRPQGAGCDIGAYERIVAPPLQAIPALGATGLALLALLLGGLAIAALRRRTPGAPPA